MQSNLAKKIQNGKKVISIEITPPKSVIIEPFLEKVMQCKHAGVDAVNIPDCPRASTRISALSAAIMIENKIGIETILNQCCRDRNIIGIQSDLLGAYSMGIKNCFIITGDPAQIGDCPTAKPVFDVDAIGLIKIINNLNNGKDISDNIVNPPLSMYIGAGVNPCIDGDKELVRFYDKYKAGMQYTITQPVFDTDSFFRFMEKIKERKINIPVIAGIWPLVSLKNALFLKNEVPGVQIPDYIIEHMEKSKTKEDGIKYGIESAQKIKEKINNVVNGFQISAPFGNVDIALSVLK